jgi:hypothetical protein
MKGNAGSSGLPGVKGIPGESGTYNEAHYSFDLI